MTEAKNKIAVVTGAGTGVGRAASLALMGAGFTVVLAGRRLEMLEETRKLGEKLGNSLPVSADMADPGSIAALFAKVAKAEGAALVPFLLKGVADGPQADTMFQADRIHPNAAAHPLILDNVWPVLEPLLRH